MSSDILDHDPTEVSSRYARPVAADTKEVLTSWLAAGLVSVMLFVICPGG